VADLTHIDAVLDQAAELVASGQTPKAAELVGQLQGQLPADSIQELRYQAFMGLSALTRGMHHEGVRILIPIVDALENSQYSSEAIRALSRLGIGLGLLGDPEGGLPWATRAINLAERLDDKLALVAALSNLGAIHFERHDYTAAKAAYARAVEICKQTASPNIIMLILNKANNDLENADSEDTALNPAQRAERGKTARTLILDSMHLIQDHPNSFVRGYAFSLLAASELVMGLLEDADKHAQAALAVDAGEGRPLPEAALTKGKILREKGHLEEAARWFQKVLDYGTEQHDSYLEALRCMERILVLQDKPKQAMEWADRRSDYLSAYYKKRLQSMAEVASLVADVQRVRQRSLALEEENQTLSLIGELGKDLAGTRDKSAIIASVKTHLSSLVRHSAFGIFMVENDALTALELSEDGLSLHIDPIPLHSQTSMVARCARERQEIFYNDAVKADQQNAVLPGTESMASSVFSPLMVGSRLIGVLTVQAHEAGRFGRRERSIFSSLCSYTAIALDNAIAYDELAQANRQIQDNLKHLVLSERMASLGRLTAGIAHEMNTPLAAMRASIATAKKLAEEYRASIGDPDVEADDHRQIAQELLSSLSLADRAGERAASFVHSIKGKTREDKAQDLVRFDPEDAFRSTVPLLEHRLLEKSASLEIQGAGGNYAIIGSPARFSQVLTNLIDNAVDALPPRNGSITVGFASSGGTVQVSVRDNGSGMDTHTAERAFEPMFTTKPFGQGTGLGLSIVRDIVSDSFRGQIRCESAPGKGTLMTVEIPLAGSA